MRGLSFLFGVLFALLTFAGCSAGSNPPIVLSDVEVTAPRPGANMSAGYLSLTNNGSATLSIDRVTSPQFASVELHETTTVDGISRMRPIPSLEVPPGGTITLERGGKHLMLMRPIDAPRRVSLNFYSGEELLISVDTEIAAE